MQQGQKKPPKQAEPETGFLDFLAWLWETVWSWITGAFSDVLAWIGPLDFGTVFMILFLGILAVMMVFTIRLFRLQTGALGNKKKNQAETIPVVHWSDIAGCDEAIDSLKEVVSFLRNPKQFKDLGARVPGGVLLHGPPGTGKTLLAKAVASNAAARFFFANASDFVNTYVGTGAASVRALFKGARNCGGPAVIFIDEIDAIGGKRTGSDHGGRGEYEKTLNGILSELDGFQESEHPIILIAATNLASNLDPALLRPGRIDRKIQVPLPDLPGREKILRIHSAKKPLASDVDLKSIARRTVGASGAELANICNEAAIFAGRDNRKRIRQQDFSNAVRHEYVGQATKKPLTDREKKVIAYHEAGHTVIGMVEPELDPVESVTIIPHSTGSLGHTLSAPEEDRHLSHKSEIEAELRMLFGGRAAELFIGEETNGASGDMQRAHQLAKAYVGQWGWGETKLLWPNQGQNISDLMLHELDRAAAELAGQALLDAQEILATNADLLTALASALLEYETLERAEVEAICSDYGVIKQSAHTNSAA